MIILAIESSCDETAVAIVQQAHAGAALSVRADVVVTQADIHAAFGGVVPEVASREHMKQIVVLVEQALHQAGCSLADISAVAVTTGPGLIGALFVGVLFAKGFALGRGLPLIGVNHLEAHLAAVDLVQPEPVFPHVALLVSGGHTALYRVDGPFRVRTLGTTLDDAAGEAFDKTAKMLGLGYPGGAKLSRLADAHRAGAASKPRRFPAAMLHSGDCNMSFSGLKTAVRQHLQRAGDVAALSADELGDVCADIQDAIVDALVAKTAFAMKEENVANVVMGGGVAANASLRRELALLAANRGGVAVIPPPKWCTDNGAMIAAAGLRRFRAGKVDSLSLKPLAHWPLGDALAALV